MKSIILVMVIFCLIPQIIKGSSDPPPELILHKVYFVRGPENFQPSGLTLSEGRLYTISDKHDRDIFRLDLKDDQAMALPSISIFKIASPSFKKLDFEGITHDTDGDFFLVSETQKGILHVSKHGEAAEWIAFDLKTQGEKAGLFQVKNAGPEGICRMDGNRLMVCAERDPRGFVEIDLSAQPVDYRAWPQDQSRFDFPEGVSSDFTGLCYYRNALYVLERNAFLVCRLIRESGTWREGPAWSYKHVETADPYRYADMTYGKAEGLCMDDQFIYIIIDNNHDGRAENPADRRPLLMVFHHPDNFE